MKVRLLTDSAIALGAIHFDERELVTALVQCTPTKQLLTWLHGCLLANATASYERQDTKALHSKELGDFLTAMRLPTERS